MKADEKRSATARAERSRLATKNAIAREMAYAGILTRLWPSYVMKSKRKSDGGWFILAVDSPAGLLCWKLSPEERASFEWVTERPHTTETVVDRLPTLLHLASDSWT
jgi:hypothetical protein